MRTEVRRSGIFQPDAPARRADGVISRSGGRSLAQRRAQPRRARRRHMPSVAAFLVLDERAAWCEPPALRQRWATSRPTAALHRPPRHSAATTCTFQTPTQAARSAPPGALFSPAAWTMRGGRVRRRGRRGDRHRALRPPVPDHRRGPGGSSRCIRSTHGDREGTGPGERARPALPPAARSCRR